MMVPDEIALTPAPGFRVIWERSAVAAYARGAADSAPAWRLEPAPAPEFSLLRVLTAATANGSLVVLAAVRPRDAEAHGEEHVAAVVGTPDEGLRQMEETLISTQYAGDGSIRRIGLELYAAGEDFPLRGAGDATATGSPEPGDGRRRSARLRFRLGGEDGFALYEILHAG